MTKYLLDTNVISDLARNPKGAVAGRLIEIDPEDVVTSVIVSCEVLFGLEKTPGRNAARSAEFLETLTVLPVDQAVARPYARIRHALSGNGKQISPNDMLIAAHAVALGAVLVTANEREFARVPGLKVENWLRA